MLYCSCTDCFFLLLLIASWIGMSFIGLIVTGVIDSDSLQKGNPARLTNAIDLNGDICGYSPGVKSKKYAYYLPSLAGK